MKTQWSSWAIWIWRFIFWTRPVAGPSWPISKEITGRILKKDSRSFDGLRFAGNIALARNDTSGAILKFQQANLVKPDQPDLTLTLVQTLFAARRDEEAESLASAQLIDQKTFAPLYDALYVHYMRGNRTELAEQVLRAEDRQQSAPGGRPDPTRIPLSAVASRSGRAKPPSNA